MKMNLLKLLVFSCICAFIPRPVSAQALSSKFWDEFLPSQKFVKKQSGDLCLEGQDSFTFMCTAGPGLDQTGLPKMEGWIYWQVMSEYRQVTYHSPVVSRLTLNGQNNRYMYTRKVKRHFDPGSPGTAPTVIQTTKPSSNCVATGNIDTSGTAFTSGGFSGSVGIDVTGGGYASGDINSTTDFSLNSRINANSSCTYDPGEITIIGGEDAISPHANQHVIELIVDCTDLTFSEQRVNGYTWQKFRPIKGIDKELYGHVCIDYFALPVMSLNSNSSAFHR